MYRYYIAKEYQPHKVNTLKKGKKEYKEHAIYLDTETSNNHEKDTPISWITSWCFEYDNDVVLGRTPTQLMECFNSIKETCNDNEKVIIYVHNLSYDITFLFKFLINYFGENFRTLCVDTRKYITFSISCFEFRCSYKLSNKSLNKWCKDLNTKHKKKVGSYDYDRIIYQDTPLSFSDWKYQVYDVLTLKDCVLRTMEIYGYSLLDIPLTSTGFIRKDILRNSKTDKKNYDNFYKIRLNEKTNKMCVDEFAGGMTHGNRYFRNKTIICLQPLRGHYKKGITFRHYTVSHNTHYSIVYHHIEHNDFVSHYPSQICAKKDFPVSKYTLEYTKKDNIKKETIFGQMKDKCFLFSITIKNMTLKQGVTIPFAQFSKFNKGRIGQTSFITDNGRILKMTGFSTVCLNEYDFKILTEQYTFKYKINEVYTAKKDFLPNFLRDSINFYFKGKTDLKNRVETLEKMGASDIEIFEAKTDLMKAKNGLNGIYGCMATAILRTQYTIDTLGIWHKEDDVNVNETLQEYYHNRNHINSYQQGITVTSLARFELYEYIKAIGYRFVLYCDTDSIFYIATPKVLKAIERLNKQKRQDAIDNKAFIITDDNTKVFYDEFKSENEYITAFRFLHSKCYAYINNNKLHCTIAGVTSLSRYYLTDNITREKELKKINNLKTGYVFDKCGGTCAEYLTYPVSVDNINGHLIEYADGVIISNVKKTLKNKDEQLDIDYIERWCVDDSI